MKSRAFIIAVLFTLACLSVKAWAACSTPTAGAGGRNYFAVASGHGGVFGLCDGTNWQEFRCPDSTWTATLKGYWKFDESSGNATDSSGNSNTGTASNITYATSGGYRGGAFSFNGTTSYVNAGSAAGLDNIFGSGAGTASASISAWIYPTGQGENNNGQIIGKDSGAGSATATNGWTLRITATNALKFTIDNATTDLVRQSSNNAITLNAWNHVVLTWTGSNTATNVHIYVNGAEVSYATTTSGSGNKNSDASNNLVIGNDKTADLSRTFAGYIDEAYVFSGILSATEISTLKSRGCVRLGLCSTAGQLDYSSADTAFKSCDGTNWLKIGCTYDTVTAPTNPDDNTAPSSGLIHWWKLDEASGTNTAADSGSNPKNLTRTTNGTPVNFTAGRLKNGIKFPAAVGNYFSNANLGDVYSLNALTYSLWFKRAAAGAGIQMGISNSSPYDQEMAIDIGTSGAGATAINVGVTSGGGTAAGGYFTNNDTAWHHLVMVFDGTQTGNASRLKAYLDDVQQTLTFTGTIPATTTATTNTFFLGKTTSADAGDNSGYLDDVRVYNRALSATEVDQLYKSAGPVGWWKLDDASGTSAADATGNGNTGALTNGTTWTTGKIGGAVSNDGTNQYVSVPDVASVQLPGSWTASAWVNVTAMPAGGQVGALLGKDVTGILGNYMLLVSNGGLFCTGFLVDFNDSGGTDHYVCLNTTITLGAWYHVAGVWDAAAGKEYLYVDGAPAGSNTPGATPVTGSGGVLYMGYDPLYGAGLNAKIDDARVYDRALSAGEVASLAARGAEQNGPVGYWKLDDASGTSAADSSGSGNAGTLTNGPTWGTGMVNGDTVFDGTDDYISIGNVSALQLTGSVTVTAWIKPTIVGDAEHEIFSKYDPGTNNRQYDLRISDGDCATNGVLEMALSTNGTTSAFGCGSTPITANQWSFVASVYDSSSQNVYMYLNGGGEGTTPVGLSSLYNGSASAYIGIKSLTNMVPFNGQIDEVHVYNRVLSASELASIYTAEKTTAGTCPSYGSCSTGGKIEYSGGVLVYCDGSKYLPLAP